MKSTRTVLGGDSKKLKLAAGLFIGQPKDAAEGLEAMYQTAADLARRKLYAQAMDTLLDVLRKNRNYRDGEAKQVMLALFELLGDDPIVNEYRRKLANVLF